MIRSDGDYFVNEDEFGFYLMHRVFRPDTGGHSQLCVGEAVLRTDGIWDIRIAYRNDRLKEPGQIMVCFSDSRSMALEVLWEQRLLMNWGYYQ